MKIIKRVLPFILIILFFILVIFAIVEKDDTNINDKKNKIVYSIDSIPDSFQHEDKLTSREQDIICAVSKGLVSRNNDGKIVPVLAESYSVSKDGIEYIFKIKDDNKWSDGTTITIKDICDFFKSLIKYSDESEISALMNVYGVKDYKESKISFDNGVAITECADNSIKFRLNSKDDNFINELAKVQYRIKQSFIFWNNLDEYYDEILYSGDYKIVDFKQDKIELKSLNKKDKFIDFVCDADSETAMASFKLGNRDIVINPPYSILNDLDRKGNLITYPSKNETYIGINSNNDNLDINARKSIYKSINEAINDFQKSNNNLLELSEGSYYRSEKEDLNKLQKRKVIVNSATENIKVKQLTLCCIDEDINKLLCNYLFNWFKEEKNIIINYEFITKNQLYDYKLYKKYDMAIINGEYEKNTIKNIYYNLKDYFNEYELEQYYEEKESDKCGDNIEDILFNNCTIMPLFYLNNNICVSGEKNIVFDYYNNIQFSKL